jgi:hypothetical protein
VCPYHPISSQIAIAYRSANPNASLGKRLDAVSEQTGDINQQVWLGDA